MVAAQKIFGVKPVPSEVVNTGNGIKMIPLPEAP
jgi:hypothetical protein